MRNKALYCWPKFTYARVLTKEEQEPKKSYEIIFSMMEKGLFAYLVDDVSLSKFIDELGICDEDNGRINLHELYMAYNFRFPLNSVSLIWGEGKKSPPFADFADLLRFILTAPREDKCRVKISGIDLKEQKIIRREILQQFIYLNMFLPVITDYTEEIAANTYKPSEIAVIGTKKAGKSALIDALLESEYAPFSTLVPTPNRVLYAPYDKDDAAIKFEYGKGYLHFDVPILLREHMENLFRQANQSGMKLDEMRVYIKDFPEDLKDFIIADTPGPNFAGAAEHQSVTLDSIEKTSNCLFVLNYSVHLTNDEVSLLDDVYKSHNYADSNEPLIIAVNKIDDMYDATEPKSIVRIIDYIRQRIKELGYENFIVIPVSGILSVYLNKVASILPDKGIMWQTLEQIDGINIENEKIDKIVDSISDYLKNVFKIKDYKLEKDIEELRKIYKNSDYISAIRFVDKIKNNAQIFHNMEVNKIEVLEQFSGIKLLTCYLRYIIGKEMTDFGVYDEILSKISNFKDNLFDELSNTIKNNETAVDKIKKIRSDCQITINFH